MLNLKMHSSWIAINVVELKVDLHRWDKFFMVMTMNFFFFP